MTQPRPDRFTERWTQLPLPQLLDDEDVNVAGRWSFAIVTIGPSGRVTLPAEARALIDGRGSLRLSARGEVALLRDGGGGRAVAVDGRGRIVVPRWLRDAAEPDRSLLVGAGTGFDDRPVVLLAPSRLLGGFADAMVGER